MLRFVGVNSFRSSSNRFLVKLTSLHDFYNFYFIIKKNYFSVKNRHHFSLFIRNCKLVMLLRREFQDGEENIFRPAEWRWRMPQVSCTELNNIEVTRFKILSSFWFDGFVNLHWYFNYLLEICCIFF